MQTLPWYKQFWPWFILSIPMITVVTCIFFIVYSVQKGPDMVVDDYYKQGKAINLELSKFQKAKALYLHGDLTIDADKVTFAFTKGDASKVTALKLAFYHPTLKENDFDMILAKNANGHFSGFSDHINQERYTIFIEPMDQSWKLKENIVLPATGPFKITPEYK
ncbi:FixH family protein [Pseudoalteromonas tunicata]|uniref:FixH family protein n=1 Tax=Pseudoalteromonas tunicata TaxID=314281 RepID=UPI00273F5F09|nr:FixH family protein [Pseudoalteromonas tunicata]MDP4983351.1 FixH family protein [Pseudoalteromonas tunicata]MDP5214061.1 FixH family protein [Pseudoalteromonas tunicata]